jgi:glycosyltransferase involved in cell wall biosynthesis
VKVLVVVGTLPQDTSWLSSVGEEVELHLVASTFSYAPAGIFHNPQAPSGIQTTLLDPIVRTKRGHLWWWYRDFSRLLRTWEPDVIHVNSEPWGLLMSQALGGRSGTAVISHGSASDWSNDGWLERHARLHRARSVLRRLSGFAGENDASVALARGSGLPSGAPAVRVHPNPRDERLFRPPTPKEREDAKTALGLTSERPLIGYLGRLVPEKGVLDLVAAWRELAARGSNATLVFGGSGPLKSDLERSICPHDGVVIGDLSFPQGVLQFLWASDVIVVPSYATPSWQEGSSRVAVEALLTGRPVVVSDSGALPETVGDAGLVFRERDRVGLATGIEAALEPGRARSLSAQARSHSVEHFAAGVASDRLRALWRDALTFASAQSH